MNNIGLNSETSKILSEKLNALLANYQVFYMNTRGFHWNIKGPQFFQLHSKFEELYTDSLLKIDEIAERILTLGQSPLHCFSDYNSQSNIKECKNISDSNKAVKTIVQGLQSLLSLERELLTSSNELGDEGTGALMSDYIREQEKAVWMYSAFLNQNK